MMMMMVVVVVVVVVVMMMMMTMMTMILMMKVMVALAFEVVWPLDPTPTQPTKQHHKTLNPLFRTSPAQHCK